MPQTNAPTAAAATRTAAPSSQPLAILGLFTGPDSARALIRKTSGETVMLTQGVPEGDLLLLLVW